MHVIPGIGIDELRFGMTRDVVRAIVGDPEERTVVDPGGGQQMEAWYYWSRGLSLHFDAEDDDRLGCIELDAEYAELNGRCLEGLTFEGLRSIFPELGLEWCGDEFEPVTVDHWSLNFWIEDGVLYSVQWGVLFADEETVIWPEPSA